jgi:DNA polymerase-3 subunit delta'
MNLPWLEKLSASWQTSEKHGRAPHAVMLLGAPGTGKRCFAAWLASQRLGLSPRDAVPQFPLEQPEHADLQWISPPEDKHTVGIDQIRALVTSMSMTSYAGGSKVAVVEPAQAMTVNAANSLLKTLEEPPGDALLILVADRVGKIPATVFSRCQRISVALPPVPDSLAWLDRVQASDQWPRALSMAGNAPLAAIVSLERMEETQALARDFAAIPERKAMPLEVAARWAKLDPAFVLDWLGQQVQLCIFRIFREPVPPTGAGVSDTVLQRMDRRNLFCYLDVINRLRAQPAGSYNVQLTFESLLIDWALGLPNREI